MSVDAAAERSMMVKRVVMVMEMEMEYRADDG